MMTAITCVNRNQFVKFQFCNRQLKATAGKQLLVEYRVQSRFYNHAGKKKKSDL